MKIETYDRERYSCQLQMKDFGSDGQDKLKQSKVLVIGAGGLGCPVLQYLTGAGVGHIGIVDNDVVELSNLHRQTLYTTDDIGKGKAETAMNRLRKLNPEIHIHSYPIRITNKEALSILSEYDIIMDGSDNFATRFMINDACAILKRPLIFGAIGETEGQIGVFHHSEKDAASNLRDLYPSVLPEDAAYTCKERGTLGVVPGIIGMLMATEAIKLITKKGTILANQLMTYNMNTNQFFRFDIIPSANSNLNRPLNRETFLNTDYLLYTRKDHTWKEINGTEFDTLISNEHSIVIDVRRENEYSDVQIEQSIHIPIESLIKEKGKLEKAEHIIVICSGGVRSKIGATILQEHFGESKKIYSLKGGIRQWKDQLKIFS